MKPRRFSLTYKDKDLVSTFADFLFDENEPDTIEKVNTALGDADSEPEEECAYFNDDAERHISNRPLKNMFEFAEDEVGSVKIKIIGLGGGGCNAVNTMVKAGLKGVDFIACNTDLQALNESIAPTRLQIGANLTKGLGAGANPEIGKRAAIEDYEQIHSHLEGTDIVFMTVGMGGGTGTGAAPIIAKIAKEAGILTTAVVTKPFLFEGKRRFRQAEEGLRELRNSADTIIVIPNQRLLNVVEDKTSLQDAFITVDNVLKEAVQSISGLITVPGLINLDFADIKAVMHDMGIGLMGTASATGENKAREAAQKSISNPLLEETSIKGAKGILINITGGPDTTLKEINEAATVITDVAHEESNIIIGSVIDESIVDEIKVTVIATGFSFHNMGSVVPYRRMRSFPEIDDRMAPVNGEKQLIKRLKLVEGDRSIPVIDKDDLEVPAFMRKKASSNARR